MLKFSTNLIFKENVFCKKENRESMGILLFLEMKSSNLINYLTGMC
jgi:hypothetical protein